MKPLHRKNVTVNKMKMLTKGNHNPRGTTKRVHCIVFYTYLKDNFQTGRIRGVDALGNFSIIFMPPPIRRIAEGH